MISEADTDDLVDPNSVLDLLGYWNPLRLPPDAMRLLQQEICFPWTSIDLMDRVRLTMISPQDAEVFKLILGPGPLPRAAFELCLPSRSTRTLFSYIAKSIGHCYRITHDEASWQAILGEAVGVDAYLCISEVSESPIIEFLGELEMISANTGSLQRSLHYWLQSLQRSGADLVRYGQLETSLMKSSHHRSRIQFEPSFYHFHGSYPYRGTPEIDIINLTYGAEPQDWTISLSWPFDEWAGELWYMLDNPELFNTPEPFKLLDIAKARLSE